MRWAGAWSRRLAAALLCTGLGGALAACNLNLEPIVSCGDGYVDVDAGEKCDPAAEDNDTPCNPETCQFAEEYCGNARIDPGEACDTADFGNKDCPSGKGYLSCNPDCTLDERTCDPCGNGEVDPGEECDPTYVAEDSGFADPVQCATLTAFPLKPYTTGVVTSCTDKCKWYRGPCGYCGDNEADPPTLVDLNYPDDKSEEEWCDGEDKPLDRVRAYCDDNCPLPGLECATTCLDDCSAFDPSLLTAEKLQCCRRKNDPCPGQNEPAPCCYAYQQGFDDLFHSDACTQVFDGQSSFFVCK